MPTSGRIHHRGWRRNNHTPRTGHKTSCMGEDYGAILSAGSVKVRSCRNLIADVAKQKCQLAPAMCDQYFNFTHDCDTMTRLADLPADARIRLTSIAPALSEEQSAQLITAIEKLFQQFLREDRICNFATEVLGHGQILAVGWVNTNGPLSGCSHDKLGQILLAHETRSGCQLLDAPPIVVAAPDKLHCVDRAMLKALVTSGVITQDSIHWDLRVETLEAWRTTGQRPALDTWLGPVIQRAQQVG